MKGVVENAFCNNRDVDCDNSMMFYSAGALNNRIHRNRSDNSLGISVWSEGVSAENRLVPDYFNVFAGNVLEDQGSFWMTLHRGYQAGSRGPQPEQRLPRQLPERRAPQGGEPVRRHLG